MGYRSADVVIALPGITGSELARGRQVIWGWSGGVLMRNLITAGAALRRDLAIPEDSATDEMLDDGITATRMLPRLHVIAGLWKIDGYGVIDAYLKSSLQLQEGLNYFPFPYDWRRDNRASARRLARLANGWLAHWRQASGAPQAKLILVAHSMGGLVARYFLEVLGGWRITRALITFGTPYAGSLNAIDALVNGLDKLSIDLTDVVRRFYSLHQLLPTYPCWDLGHDGGLVELGASTLPGVEPRRFADAAAFHREIAEAAEQNAREESYRTDGYQVYPIVGYNQVTQRSFRLDRDRAEFITVAPDHPPDGDGTVPRISAVPAGFDLSRAMFTSTKHAALQSSAAALAHVIGVVSSIDYRTRAGQPELPTHLTLQVRDAYFAPEPAVIRAVPTHTVSGLRIDITDCATGTMIEQALM